MSKQWMPLDNAALIFPAVRRSNWTNVFRVSATLKDHIDPVALQQAVDDLKPRFPSMYVRLRRGMFWYYLEEVATPPQVREDFAYPLTHMGQREVSRCGLRVFYYQNRIAAEMFHSLTDGTGGMIYLKTLVARYLTLKYGVDIPCTDGVLDYTQSPSKEELEDSFPLHSSKYAMSRKEPTAVRLSGTREAGFLHLTTGVVSTAALAAQAHAHGATVTVFLSAVMAQVILEMQAERTALRHQKPVKITVPVNLRRLYGSKTLRNFVLALNPGVDPKFGSYTLNDLCRAISSQLIAEATPQQMAGRIAANVKPQQTPMLKIAPLFVKNLAMRLVYASIGERKGCLNLSNLGKQELPDAMLPYVQRLEFIVGVQSTYPNNCAVATLGDVTCINMIRNIRESELERRFFSRLVELGVAVDIEANQRR